MDLFRFTPNPASPTTLLGGESIGGYLSAMWVERYQDCGEFQIRALLSSGLREYLPIDSFISHTNTLEVMIVENHEIIDENDSDAILVITGRSMLSILDRRITGFYVKYNTTGNYWSYGGHSLGTNWASFQISNMIQQHIASGYVAEKFENIYANSIVSEGVNSPDRQIKNDELLNSVIECLKYTDLGIKTVRRNPWGSGAGSSATATGFIVYKGTDQTKTVIFSYERGDIEKANYLWTNKNYKNGMLLFGNRFSTFYDDPVGAVSIGLSYRAGFLMVGDIEGYYSQPITDQSVINEVVAKMRSRAQQELPSHKKTALVQADISPLTNYFYRRDYNMGDLVMVDGNYGLMQVMRVVEHVEITDENGTSAHPTLALPPS